jgi:hypothetical protein
LLDLTTVDPADDQPIDTGRIEPDLLTENRNHGTCNDAPSWTGENELISEVNADFGEITLSPAA